MCAQPVDPRQAPTVPRRESGAQGRPHGLVVVEPGLVRRCVLPARGEVQIGRGEAADIQLDDPAASRMHAKLVLGEVIEVVDLGSSNGTRVAGERLRAHRHRAIGTDTPLEIGDCVLILQSFESKEPTVSRPTPSAMPAVYEQAMRLAAGSLPILLVGDSGTGKQWLAARIHERSARSGPQVTVHCRGATVDALEAELFGEHERQGAIARAEGGMLVLAEVCDVPLGLQARLLRVLERGEANVRFVSTSQLDPPAAVRTGRLRKDLLYRLGGAMLGLPSLRERRDALPELTTAILAELCAAEGRPVPTLGETALAGLREHDWPGNLHELRNVLCTTLQTSSAPTLEAADLPPLGDGTTDPAKTERDRIVEALAEVGGNQSRAAKLLGISRRTLVSRLDKYGIPRPRKR